MLSKQHTYGPTISTDENRTTSDTFKTFVNSFLFEPLVKFTYGYQHIRIMIDTFIEYTKLYTSRQT